MKASVLQFKNQILDFPKGLTAYQIASIISASAALILMGFNLSASYQKLYVNFIFSYGTLGLMLFGVWIILSLAFAFQGYLWYKIMVRSFQVRKKEIEFLTKMRSLTKKVSDWMYVTLEE
jgi:hypothetical protein